jgi:hypothetical protein
VSASRLCLVIAFVLFVIASLLSFDVLHAGWSVEGLALLAFGFWALSGAV